MSRTLSREEIVDAARAAIDQSTPQDRGDLRSSATARRNYADAVLGAIVDCSYGRTRIVGTDPDTLEPQEEALDVELEPGDADVALAAIDVRLRELGVPDDPTPRGLSKLQYAQVAVQAAAEAGLRLSELRALAKQLVRRLREEGVDMLAAGDVVVWPAVVSGPRARVERRLVFDRIDPEAVQYEFVGADGAPVLLDFDEVDFDLVWGAPEGAYVEVREG